MTESESTQILPASSADGVAGTLQDDGSSRTPAEVATGVPSQPVSTSAMGRAEVRIHAFHLFGTTAPLILIALGQLLGGDPFAMHLVWAGGGVLGACNAYLMWITARPGRYHADRAVVAWFEGRWTGQTMGAFRLGLVLGRGSMGEVYEATSADGSVAAVKLLNVRATADTSMVDRFHREMQVAARLESPHIVKLLAVSPPGAPVPYIAMERLHGVDLAMRLRNENRMPSDELVSMIVQVAAGLEVARLAGIVHRDLKPHNLFQHDGSTWKILDFGVSKVVGTEGTLTGDGVVGTPQYMAPEQARGGEVTHAADVYALGAIAYRCLTGRSPFKGRDLSELVYQVVHAAPIRPSKLARLASSIDDVLAVAMAKDPARRFATALPFAQALVAARRGSSPALEPPGSAWQ